MPRWHVFGAVVVFATVSALAAGPYSRLEKDSTCADFRIDDVITEQDCFNNAAPAVGLGSVQKVSWPGMSFTGCAYNTQANLLIFSHNPDLRQNVGLDTLEFLCSGTPTTTTSGTGTTTTTSGIFAKLDRSLNCWDRNLPEVPSMETCFETAVHFVGLAGVPQQKIDSIGFTGCVYNNEADVVLYGTSEWVTNETTKRMESWEYICNGVLEYTKLSPNQNCFNNGLQDVLDEQECFKAAAPGVGLRAKPQQSLPNMGFVGCVYNTAEDVLMYSESAVPAAGESTQITPETSHSSLTYEYVCHVAVAPTPTPPAASTLPPLFP